tara:strand:+ start:4122 stop:4271 length:150 start_codon:yes stop_codon:yes gene_type:complete
MTFRNSFRYIEERDNSEMVKRVWRYGKRWTFKLGLDKKQHSSIDIEESI